MILQAEVAAALPVWAWFLFLVLGAIAGAWVAQRIVIRILRQMTKRTDTRLDDMVLRAIAPSLTLAFFVAGMWIGFQYSPVAFSATTHDIIGNTAATLIIVAVAMAIARLVGGLLAIPARREPRWRSASALGTRVLSALIYAIALMMILRHLGQEITPLIASLGIAAIAVALALQDTLTNFLAGIWIQAGRTLQPGHLVEFEDPKIMGFVEEIGWRTTKIKTLPNNIVVIPNKTVAEATVTDYDLPEPRMGTNMTIVTGFEADPDRVIEILLDSVKWVAQNRKELGILEEPEPAARLNDITERGLAFWLGFQCQSWFHQWNGGGAIRTRILQRFQEEGIRTPYPMREIFVVPPERADVAEGPAAGNGSEGQEKKPAPKRQTSDVVEAAGPIKAS